MRGLILLLALPLLTACEIEEGEVVVYRVSVSSEKVALECFFPSEERPADIASDSDSFRTSQTWVLYKGTADDLVLDANGFALTGGDGEDGFEFVGHDIDVTYVGMDQQEAKITEVDTTTINMITDGDAINGDIVSNLETRCDFLVANPSPGLCSEIPDCKRTRTFSGVRLDDVELTDGVDRPNPNGTMPPPPPEES